MADTDNNKEKDVAYHLLLKKVFASFWQRYYFYLSSKIGWNILRHWKFNNV